MSETHTDKLFQSELCGLFCFTVSHFLRYSEFLGANFSFSIFYAQQGNFVSHRHKIFLVQEICCYFFHYNSGQTASGSASGLKVFEDLEDVAYQLEDLGMGLK